MTVYVPMEYVNVTLTHSKETNSTSQVTYGPHLL